MLVLTLLIYLTLRNVESANILGVCMIPSISHQVVYQTIWKELSLRGHNVTVITPDPLNDPSLTNLTEISIRFVYDIAAKIMQSEVVKTDDLNKFRQLIVIHNRLDIIAEEELNSTVVQELLTQKRNFDLIFTECFHPVMYAFSGKYKAPIIAISSIEATTVGYDMIGNPTHPVLYPDFTLGLNTKNLSIWDKITSILFSIWFRIYYFNFIVPRSDRMARKYFGDDIPYVGDLERNMSMLFLNVNPLIFPPRPNVPSVVEMGLMHIKPTKPLSKDLKKILDEARGVVYFSLGSNVKSVNINENQRSAIVEALRELPYTVLWKWESDHLPGKPENVVIRKWYPQQDVLAHPNVKVFVTQGGLQSLEEAISRGVPLVGMPFRGDQFKNVIKMVELGIGVGLDRATFTKEDFKRAVTEVAENVQYKNKIREVRDILYDKPMTGLEKAVWWSEYVIRHKGARHLRSPMADISWFEYLLLDVILVVFVLPIVIIYLSYRAVRMSLVKLKK